MAIKKEHQAELEIESKDQTEIAEVETKSAKFWKIKSNDFLYLLTEASLILYPGSFAVINDSEFKGLPKYAKDMFVVSEIKEDEYKKYRATQGILGAS